MELGGTQSTDTDRFVWRLSPLIVPIDIYFLIYDIHIHLSALLAGLLCKNRDHFDSDSICSSVSASQRRIAAYVEQDKGARTVSIGGESL